MEINYNQNYVYYLYGTNIKDERIIADFFYNGILNYKGNNLLNITTEINEKLLNSKSLDEIIKLYTGYTYDSTFLIKIPKLYLALELYPNGQVNFPIPLLKEVHDVNNNKIFLFTNYLIECVYYKDHNAIVFNQNYYPFFNPNGFVYDQIQINNLKKFNQTSIIEFAEKRGKFSFDELNRTDAINNSWVSLIEQFKAKISLDVNHQKEIDNYINDELPDPELFPQYDFSFEGLHEVYDLYYLKDNKVYKKQDNSEEKNPYIVSRFLFSNLWLESNSIRSWYVGIEYDYAFNNGARELYNYLMKSIQKQLLKNGNINTKEIVTDCNVEYQWGILIIKKLFSTTKDTKILTDYFRMATPQARPQTKLTLTIDETKEEESRNSLF